MVDHRGIGRGTVLLPHRAGVEALERPRSGLHVREVPDPDEAIRIREIAELPEDAHAVALLGLDEVLLEHAHQGFARARVERVLAQLDDRANGIHHTLMFDQARTERNSQFRENA